ncbi:MAG: hypothetical protein AAF747_06335 [Planctomycetota bacterium]
MPFRVVRLDEVGERVGRVYSVASSQPSWVTRIAVSAMLVVLTAIVLAIAIPAILVFVLVFSVLAVIAQLKRAVTGGGSGRASTGADASGRRNVRVIERR